MGCVLLLAGSPADAGALHGTRWCDPGGTADTLIVAARSGFYEARRARAAIRSQPRVDRVGNLAIIEDDGSILNGNRFDLAGTSLRFTPRSGGYKVKQTGGSGIGRPGGERLVLDDDEAVLVELPGFRFDFYDASYDGVWVGADGQLTFGRSGGGISARDLAELLAGPPRIAALFADLGPELADGDGGVWVDAEEGELIRVTWYEVPFRLARGGATVEVVLHRDGTIELAWGEVGASPAVVGVSPGRARDLELVDLSDKKGKAGVDTALAEEFTSLAIDITAIGRAFHSRFSPTYMSLLAFFDLDLNLSFLASHRLVANDIEGIGIGPVGSGGIYGSPQLQSFITMGSVDQYPDDPDETFNRTFSTMDVIGHEVAHRWTAFVRFADGSPRGSRRLLGRQLAHWSFFFDSDASIMEGNDILDLGGGEFRTVDASRGFGPLDLYLMGLAPPEAVPGFFWVEGDEGAAGPRASAPPEIGVEFTGERHDLDLDDIVEQEGARFPADDSAPKSFATAFVLVVPDGTTARESSIERVTGFLERWPSYFDEATGGRGSVTASLVEGR